MKAIGLYLRPLSDFNTGTEAYIESKVEYVENIEVESPKVNIQQKSEIRLKWREGVKNQPVPHSNRHWWVVVPDDWFDNLDMPLRHHGDITDFVTALNLCTDAPVSFSQSPGRTVYGYHEVDEYGNFNYKDNLSSGALGIQSAFTREVPNRVTVTGPLPSIYQRVREIRESEASSDTQIDLMIALHMYDDALTGTRWTTIANLFYVCENVLCSGYRTKPDMRIAEETEIAQEEAGSWKEMVNRLKHPDKPGGAGGPPRTLMEMVEDGTTIPSVAKMRRAVNTVLTTNLVDQ